MKSFIFGSILVLSAPSLWAAKSKPLSNKSALIVDMSVTEKGFEPNSIDVTPGKSVILKITRKTNSTCATEIQVPSKNMKIELPFNKTVSVDLGKLEKGEIRFGCGMDMMIGGLIHVR